MFKLNKKIKYALIALKHMDTKKAQEITSAKEICDAYGIPFDPTARTLQLMAQEGILQASQGAHGGYQLIRDLSQVSLKNLNDIIIGHIKIADCLDDDAFHCECIKNCIVISPLLRLNEKIHNFMDQISIRSLIDSQHHHPREEEIRKNLIPIRQGTIDEKTYLS